MTFAVVLTYAASIGSRIVYHDGPVVEDGSAEGIEAAAVVFGLVVIANDIVEDNRAIFIPPEHLNGIANSMRSAMFERFRISKLLSKEYVHCSYARDAIRH